MKKIFIVFSFVFVFSFFVTPFLVKAVSESDVQTRIEYLQELIINLQSQLDALRNGEIEVDDVLIPSPTVSIYCPSIDRVLGVGSSGNDVKELQEFLTSTGDYSYGKITGYYGLVTQTAVQNFQRRASVVSTGDAVSTGYGVFGPLTKKAIYRYCRIPDPGACTMEYDPVCGQPQMPTCSAELACPQVMPQPKTYSNMCHLKAAGAQFLYEGECRTTNTEIPKQCKVWYDGCNTCSRSEVGGALRCTMMACFVQNEPYCKEYFDDEPWEVPPRCETWWNGCNNCSYDSGGSVVCDSRYCSADEYTTPHCTKYTDDNKPPVISSFSGPTVLEERETGEWKIKASDPENGELSYHIRWGDEASWSEVSAATELDDVANFVQTTTFEHAYDNAGVYTITIVVMDDMRQQTRTSTTVKVVQQEPYACTDIYAPVCGQFTSCSTTGDNAWIGGPCFMREKTFSNKCYMNQAGYSFAYDGECDTDPIYLQ